MDNPAYGSASALLKAMAEKRLSSLELLELYMQRYEQINPRINAIVATDFAQASIRARAADEARVTGQSWGPLHGLPMTIKDCLEIQGMPCTAGSPDLKTHMPTRNAEVVDALLNAGAIIFGKTNVPLYAQDFQSYNEVYGQTNNPWDVSRTPGGSSGGSAAALAAGLTSIELGSDLGGSIRTPAHFCGVYGHKPSFNLVSLRGQIPPRPNLYPGEYSLDGDLTVIGPLARSADDLALMMEVIAQPKEPQRIAWQCKLPPPRKNRLQDYRIGLWLDDPACPVDRNVGDCLDQLAQSLARCGANIENRRPEIEFGQSDDIYSQLLNAAFSASLPDDLFTHAQQLAPTLNPDDKSFRAHWARGSTMLHRDWIRLDYQRLLLRQKWADYFKEFDVLLCPAVPVTAFAHDHGSIRERSLAVNGVQRPYMETMLPWAGLGIVSYLPATVAPIGLARDGLPVGVQIIGPYLEDMTTIHFAGLLEAVTGSFAVPPGF